MLFTLLHNSPPLRSGIRLPRRIPRFRKYPSIRIGFAIGSLPPK